MSEEYRIQPFEMKNISPILDVVVPLWSPPTGDQNFKRFNVEYIIRNNFFENDLHYQLVDEKNQYCASAFFARKGEICKAADWFELESKKFSEELLISSEMSRVYIEMMDEKTFEMMNQDDIKLTLYVSSKKGCGSKLLNELCQSFRAQGYKNLYLWTDCECNWEWYTDHGYELISKDVYEPFSSEDEDYMTYVFRKKL